MKESEYFFSKDIPSFLQIISEDGQPLSGVLLSLSGGHFRSNLLTQDTGLLTFNNLVSKQLRKQYKVSFFSPQFEITLLFSPESRPVLLQANDEGVPL